MLYSFRKNVRALFLPWIRSHVEETGRQVAPPEPKFTEDQLITPPKPFHIRWTTADFLYVYPNTAAVLTTHTGEQLFPDAGGFLENMEVGKYSLQYVDLRERRKILNNIQDTSAEGSQVSISIAVTYFVTHPKRLLAMDKPLQILFTTCTAALKSFIRSHAHDDLVCVQYNTLIEDSTIARHIIQQVNQNQACRAFTLLDVSILERQGDPRILEIQRARRVQEQQSLSRQEELRQQEKLADQEESLVIREGEVNIQRMIQEQRMEEARAMIEATRADIAQRIQFQLNKVEEMRQLPERQHEMSLKALDIRSEALHALMQMYTTPGFPRTVEDARRLEEMLQKISDIPSLNHSGTLTALSSTLDGLLP
ncbi:MAG: hypothetical protein JW726_15910 [Anaerolineales bacterium]|nr:hypothetical protein [Anaerolineales bacterium]